MKSLLIKPLVVLLFFLGLTMQLLGQQQRTRLALVIGNAAYKHGGVLKNPVHDANLMTRTLEDLGFDVIKKTDAVLKDMQIAFKEFVSRLDDYDVALFFYAGHGIQVDGQNYLIPVDAQLEDKLSLEFDAFNVSSVNKYFGMNSDKLNIMILDACRNNPYRAWMRGGGQGFGAIQNQGAGTIIAFATREGETASDGTESNGLFTQYLVEQMKIPQNITDVFQNTRVSVMEASNNQQIPQEWNMLTGNFYFTQTTSGQSIIDDVSTDNQLNNINTGAYDIIYRSDGSEIKAEIVEMTTETIKYKKFEQLDGPIRNILLSEVFMIIYEDKRREIINVTELSKNEKAEKKETTIQVPQNIPKTQDRSRLLEGEKCILGTNEADNLHGKEATHFIYGLAFGPFAVIGAAVSNPTPEKGSSTVMMSKNKELFNDPTFRTCYTKKAKRKNVGNTAAGWATWLLILLLL